MRTTMLLSLREHSLSLKQEATQKTFINTCFLSVKEFFLGKVYLVWYSVPRGGEILNNRIRELRKTLNLTAETFGSRIGIVRSAVSNIESGTRQPTNQLVTSICREFKVNEQWLRTGEGEMFLPTDPDAEIAEFVGTVPSDGRPSFRKKLIRALADLPEEGWEAIEAFARKLAEKNED